MLKSGITISEAIHIIYEQSTSKYFREVLRSLQKDILNGTSLYKAASGYPKLFDPVYLNLIKIGEESGKLEENLEYLTIQQKKNYEFTKSIQSALMYPGFILITAVIVSGGVSFFVMPQLVELFESLDVKLPLTTQILLFIANFMKNYNYYIWGSFIALFLIFRYLISRENFKPYWHSFLFSIPKIGKLLQQISLATICRNMGIMLQSGLLITTSLQIIHDYTTNYVYKEILRKLVSNVEKGNSIENTLGRIKSKFIPLILIRMIGVGEKSGKLDESLIYLGEFFEDEVNNTTKNLSIIIEPVLLIIIGLIVAFIAFSIISPIYELTGSIK